MWHLDLNSHWSSERGNRKTKKGPINGRISFGTKKREVCVVSYSFSFMPRNVGQLSQGREKIKKNKKNTRSRRNVVLKIKTMYVISKQQWILNEYANGMVT